MPHVDPFKELGVAADATLEQITRQYRRLALERHTDRGGNKEDMARLNQAYEILKNGDTRRQYENSREDEDDVEDDDVGNATGASNGPAIPLPDGGPRLSDEIKKLMEAAFFKPGDRLDTAKFASVVSEQLAEVKMYTRAKECLECRLKFTSLEEAAAHQHVYHSRYTELMRYLEVNAAATIREALREGGVTQGVDSNNLAANDTSRLTIFTVAAGVADAHPKAVLRLLAVDLRSWPAHPPSAAEKSRFHLLAGKALIGLRDPEMKYAASEAAAAAAHFAIEASGTVTADVAALQKLCSPSSTEASEIAGNMNPSSGLDGLTRCYREQNLPLAERVVAAWNSRLGATRIQQLSLADQAVFHLSHGVLYLLRAQAPRAATAAAATNGSATDAMLASMHLSEAAACAAVLSELDARVTEFVVELSTATDVRALLNEATVNSLRSTEPTAWLSLPWLQLVSGGIGVTVASTSHRFVKYVNSPDVRMLKQNERWVHARLEVPVKIALWFADLGQVPGGDGAISCFLTSAHWFLRAMDDSKDEGEHNAYATAALVVLDLASHVATRMSPATLAVAAPKVMALALRVALSKRRVPAMEAVVTVARLLRPLCLATAVCPFSVTASGLVADSVYTGIVQRQVLCAAIDRIHRDQLYDDRIVTEAYIAYLRFEGALRGWHRPDPATAAATSSSSVDDLRVQCMAAMLKEAHPGRPVAESFEHVSKLVNWGTSHRDVAGFLEYSPSQSAPAKKGFFASLLPSSWSTSGDERSSFAGVNGMTIDLKTGKLTLDVVPASQTRPGLFGMSDVDEIIRKDITATFFSLDEVNADMPCCPFQSMRFGPTGLQDTHFLATMFQADYILKFLTCGVEVGACLPFSPRSVDASSIFSRLPATLRAVCEPMRQCRGASDAAHRFWIEAGELPTAHNITENVVEEKIGGVKMIIKKHLLRRDPRTGLLVDADDDADDSVEAEFARSFTKHYDEFAKFFPELARLRELVKLASLLATARQVTRQLKQRSLRSSDELASVREKVRSGLQEVRAQITYPRASDRAGVAAHVQRILDDTYQSNRHQPNFERSWSAQRSRLESEARESVLKQLRELDAKAPDEYRTQLAKAFNVASVSRRGVEQFLEHRFEPLVNEVAELLVGENIRKVSVALAYLTSLGFSGDVPAARSDDRLPPSQAHPCCWVPTAYNQREHAVVHGGVALNIKVGVYDRNFNPPPSEGRQLAPDVLAHQRAAGQPNSTAQIIDNNRRFNEQAANNQRSQQQQQQGGGPSRRAAYREALRSQGLPTSTTRPPPSGNRQSRGEHDPDRGISRPAVPGQLFRHDLANDPAGRAYIGRNQHNRPVVIRDDFKGDVFRDGPSRGPHYNVGDRDATFAGQSLKDYRRLHFDYVDKSRPY